MFKKIFFGMSALALFAACNEDFTDWAEPQTNPEVTPLAVALTVAPQPEVQTLIDLAAVEGETVKLFSATLPEGVTVTSYNVRLADTGENTVEAKYPDWGVIADAEGNVKVEDLQNATTGMFNKEAVERTFKATVTADATVEGKTGAVVVSSVAEPFVITVKPIAPEFPQFLYVPGNAQGWNPGTAGAVESPNCDGLYTGFIYVDGGFKFTNARDWNHGDYGYDAFPGQTVFTASGDGNLVADGDAAGVYYVTLNLATMDLTAVKVTTMGIIGDFNGWGGDVEMAWNDVDCCYEATGAGVTANGWKFRINADWSVNLGGSLTDLVADGANLSVVGNTIKLYPLRNTSEKIYCTVE